MKILHINTSSDGGAAMCAIRICKALEQQGIESKMLFAQGVDIPEGIEGTVAKKDKIVNLRSNWLIAKFRHLLMRMPWYWNVEKMQARLNEDNAEGLYVHHPLSEYSNIINHPLVKWADIIHLHWVAEFVDYPTFFKKVKKPIVWTLHDMNPAVGAVHFVSDNSPVPDSLLALENRFRKIKRKAVMHCPYNMQIVAISEQMRKMIEASDVLNGFPVTLIHNGVDTNVFKINDKKCKNNVFMFSSYNIWDKRKGLSRIIKALDKVNIHKELIVVGNNPSPQKPIAPFPIKEYGLITNQNELAKLYSKADFFINASFEEGFAQAPLEAMACGTPVISTPCSGAADLIRDFNGIICNGYDADAIAFGIMEALDLKYDSDLIRQHIIDNYQYDKIANRYIDLYKSILNQ